MNICKVKIDFIARINYGFYMEIILILGLSLN